MYSFDGIEHLGRAPGFNRALVNWFGQSGAATKRFRVYTQDPAPTQEGLGAIVGDQHPVTFPSKVIVQTGWDLHSKQANGNPATKPTSYDVTTQEWGTERCTLMSAPHVSWEGLVAPAKAGEQDEDHKTFLTDVDRFYGRVHHFISIVLRVPRYFEEWFRKMKADLWLALMLASCTGSQAAGHSPTTTSSAEATGIGAPDACNGLSLGWNVVRDACICAPDDLRERCAARDEFERLTPSMEPASREVASGGTISIEILHRNATRIPVAAKLGEGSVVSTADESGHEVPGYDGASYSVGQSQCSPAPVGRTQRQNYDPATVVVWPGGAVRETYVWHAGIPERDARTCGWNYKPLRPGLYHLSLESAPSVKVDVRVLASDGAQQKTP